MGLAGVELVMSLEDHFGIDIADEEARQVVTVCAMHQLIARKLHPPEGDVCLWSDERIWQEMTEVIVEDCSGLFSRVRPLDITPDKHLWRDICQD